MKRRKFIYLRLPNKPFRPDLLRLEDGSMQLRVKSDVYKLMQVYVNEFITSMQKASAVVVVSAQVDEGRLVLTYRKTVFRRFKVVLRKGVERHEGL